MFTAFATIDNEEQRNELEIIYEKSVARLYRIAMTMLGNREDAEDAVQEAFLDVAGNPNGFFAVPETKRVSYIKTIVKRKAQGILKKRYNAVSHETDIDEDTPDNNTPIDEKLDSEMSRDEIYRFIDTLSYDLRKVLYLRIEYELSYAEIGERLGISEEAAKKRFARAKNKIKQFLEGKCHE